MLATLPLTRLERAGVLFLFVIVIPAFGVLVEYRTAFLERRMGDLDCFLRPAWAVRVGADPYTVTSANGWHYIYPPLFAILMTPLADPPPGADAAGFLPYEVSAVLFFLINVFCAIAAAHCLASAYEQASNDPAVRGQPRFCRRWWTLRLWPALACSLPMFHTFMRGQVNVFILAILAAALAGWMRGQNFRAGLWLALAICIKVIPVYLLIYPLWKRDLRGLSGCAVGLFVGLALIPALVFGPTRAIAHYETYAKVFFAPLLKLGDDQSLRDEIVSTDSIGVKNALHNWTYPDRAQRPDDLPAWGKLMYLVLGIGMTIVTLWPSTKTISGTARVARPFAALLVLMTIFSPICHSHYLVFCLPAIMCLMAQHWQFRTTIRLPGLLVICLFAFVATIAVAYLPGMEILKDRCAALFVTLPLWAILVAQMWHGSEPSQKTEPAPPSRTLVAA